MQKQSSCGGRNGSSQVTSPEQTDDAQAKRGGSHGQGEDCGGLPWVVTSAKARLRRGLWFSVVLSSDVKVVLRSDLVLPSDKEVPIALTANSRHCRSVALSCLWRSRSSSTPRRPQQSQGNRRLHQPDQPGMER